jgi:uncharacterized protein (TIGR02117 family)
MNLVKKVLKWIGYILCVPVLYLLISLVLTFITVNEETAINDASKEIFISTNGVHLDIIIPTAVISKSLAKDLNYTDTDRYLSFGWGDENFYINTPTWGDLTVSNAVNAMFFKSPTLIHLTRYKHKRKDWISIKLDDQKLAQLHSYLTKSFNLLEDNSKVLLPNMGYSNNDDFYKANGIYSCFKTCNSWVNEALKTSNLKACYWTPFDFGLINKYK